MRVLDLFCFKPFYKKREVIRDLFPVEYSVDHVTAKEAHFDFVSCMRVYFGVLVYGFEDVGGG